MPLRPPRRLPRGPPRPRPPLRRHRGRRPPVVTRRPGAFAAARLAVGPVDEAARGATTARLDRLAKPRGSLGRLEVLAAQLAAIAGTTPPPLPRPAAVAVFAADHGVHAQGVTPWPQKVTAAMVAVLAGGGAAINVLARQAGASVLVVDVGVATEVEAATGLLDRRVRPGTADLSVEPAMTLADATAALDVGAEVAGRLVEDGARCLVTGEMGIANTTASAALVAAFTGRPPVEVTGRGTGIDDDTLARKVAAVERGLAHTDLTAGALPVLASVGGLEIAALAGYLVGGAAARVPVVVDGLIAGAALLVAAALEPEVLGFCVAGHRSPEPGARATLEHLGLEPVLDLGLRLGEGTGACLALPVLEAAARIVAEMATLDDVGVSSG
ncbi:MAG: nicotinate-nucleotide--dimethylbenzimidazole phosphoribosyltransferase [Actinobacteria bacterium]|nr:nicotinate-nucleotide--dimethylbenzimidazole phosphoribosyltransferase [Actinomycetota bacterium]